MIPLMALWANPLVRKIALYGAAILAILLLLRWYGNRQWYLGEAKGRVTATTVIEKQKKEEWKAKEEALAAGAAEIGVEKRAVSEARARLDTDRANLSRSLKDGLARIQAERGRQYEGTAAIADADLDSAVRSVSAELAAAVP